MSLIDWCVLLFTLLAIVLYGSWKTRKNKNLESYLKGNNSENWATIGLSIMATQASAITFLSTPGQAYESGMGFVQFYFGLPLAMILISIFFLPIYYRLKVYTAYQYLEQRFDVRVRAFTAFLFLVSRGLAAGITIYAPAIILSTLLDWNLQLTCLLIGGLVIVYTVSGGSRAVSPYRLFLFLSYFGTDQSQVQRYLGGKTLKASRMGLMFNGILKIPMQFFILFIGAMVFVSFQFNKPPIIFNTSATNIETQKQESLVLIESNYNLVFEEKKEALLAPKTDTKTIQFLQAQQDSLRNSYKAEMSKIDEGYESKDSDYIFLTFVLNFLPHGLIGLLLAVIFSAAMSSTAGELNALASTTTIDFYKKFWKDSGDEKKDLMVSKLLTVAWGVLAIIIALTAGLFENLIQLVNILGSIFYGTILGVFLLAFFFKRIGGTAAFIGGIFGQIVVLSCHFLTVYEVIELGYLLYNVIGSLTVITVGIIIQLFINQKHKLGSNN